MDIQLGIILGAAFLLIMWMLGGAASRARSAHKESQVSLPGRLAMEVGKTYGKSQNAQWRLWFVDAEVRYVVADRAWWARYKRSSRRGRSQMLERRLKQQEHVGEMIDPIECLKYLASIARQGADPKTKPAQTPEKEPSA